MLYIYIFPECFKYFKLGCAKPLFRDLNDYYILMKVSEIELFSDL